MGTKRVLYDPVTSSSENLYLELCTRQDSYETAQLQKLARLKILCILPIVGTYAMNNKDGDDQTARMHRLICIFVVHIWQVYI